MSRQRRKGGLFLGYWFELGGKRLQRVRRPELAEAYRLLREHRDIANGRVRGPGSDVGLMLTQRMPLG